jgi:hypothetical protein
MSICGMSSLSSACTARRAHARLAVLLVVTASLLLGSAGPAAGGGAKPKPKPQILWRSYPLDNAHRNKPATNKHLPSPSAKPGSKASERPGSGGSAGNTLLVLMIAAAVTLAAAIVAALVLRLRGVAPAIPGRALAFARAAAPSFRSAEGGSVMTDQKRKSWGRESWGRESQERNLKERVEAAIGGSAESPPKPPEPSSPPAATDGQASADIAGAGEQETQHDLVDVGAAVDTVLKSAQEAAARIRRQALEEAAKIREEAKGAAADELAEARRIAEADRAEGGRVRADAEADAETIRAEADTFAERVRASAEREADQLLEEARARLARADADIEKKLGAVEGDARRRRDTFAAESKLYEERLEKMLGVFHGMTSQLEDLLGERSEDVAKPMKADAESLNATLQRAAAGGSPGS